MCIRNREGKDRESIRSLPHCQSETMAWLRTNSSQSAVSSQIWRNPGVTLGAEIYQYELLPFLITSLGNSYNVVERIGLIIRSLDLVLVRPVWHCAWCMGSV